MTEHTLDLNGLLGARLCHDLISPVGAIRNGLELLEYSANMNGPELNLIRESASSADAKLRYFRVAFGRDAFEQVMNAIDIRDIVTSYAHGTSFEIDWKISEILPKPIVKTLMLCLLCLETVIQRSGRVVVARTAGDISLTAYPKRTLTQLHLAEALRTHSWPTDLTASQVRFPLAAQAMKTCNLEPSISFESTKFTLFLRSLDHEKEITPESHRHQLQDT